MFPVLRLKGTPLEIGRTHGRHFKALIDRSLSLYIDRFSPDWKSRCETVCSYLKLYTPHLLEEIEGRGNRESRSDKEGIAEGSENTRDAIIALNSRTEFIRPLKPAGGIMGCTGECTTLCFPRRGILAQTWDWYRDSQSLTVILEIELSRCRTEF
eukprot:TRINITY_DN3571_c0_g2_i14.p1 TRINITY_DN3571_c0_g2~~TRINITY_DN3571_c0_g2_i14.p1  ORF type:complete len:155 (-),score=13.27 TRINITY_DN3571_c0_g2_i14:26-490(-)